jgi:hypothetical protein
VATGNGDVVVINSAGLIVRANALVVTTELVSAAWMVKFAAVEVVGCPLIKPVAGVSVRPAGRVPAEIDQV